MSFKSWLEKRGIWFYAQNLNEEKGKPTGSKFWHGRAWLKFNEGAFGFHWEWLLGRRNTFCHVSITVGGEDWLKISIALPYLFAIWFHIDLQHRFTEERETGFNLYQGLFSWKIWQDSWNWHAETPKWRQGSFDILDFLLGKQKYTAKTLDEDRVFIKMPEECYHGNCRIYRATWKRPRWPWPLILTRANIEMDNSIPIPGKGENAWDQGDDGIYSMTMTASSCDEAAKIFRDSVLETRKKRGWKDGKASSI